jgi:metal-responsive CopG/Arc/MetJ family transcriptional regulator
VWSTLNRVETIHVALNAALRRATERAAKRARLDRSALVRVALREYLKRLEARELDARDRRGYEEHPDDSLGASDWERVAVWPGQ